MPGSFEHLRIEREPLQNDRRTRIYKIPKHPRGDLRKHSQQLGSDLQSAVDNVRQQSSSQQGHFVLKLKYSGLLDVANLSKHGIEFVSQEEKRVCIVFSDEKGLALFADHISKLGLDDAELTHRQILEAIDGIESWSASDRKSWAVNQYGLPATETFILDVELWPIQVAHHPDRNKICIAFDVWLKAQNIHSIDRVNLDSLLMYRLSVNSVQAELLLNHSDVRFVDLSPTSGVSYKSLSRDINSLPDSIPNPPADAARICILDSGINTNHPLLAPAIAESETYIESEDASDYSGHGTAVAGIALYGDIEACNRLNQWTPELFLYNAKVLNRDCEFDEKSIEKTLVDAVSYFVNEHQCRIFNISIGNANSPYDQRHVRGMAYILDKLARDFDVLFVVSAGNFSGSDAPPVPMASWREEYPEYLISPQTAIIDPAPALNVLTIGSLAQHNATADQQKYPEITQLSPAGEGQPSPFTRHGPSIRGAIKPDLMATGGNLASPLRQPDMQFQPHMRGLGVLTCNHQFVGNTLFREISGTSFAAPFITHLAGRLLNNYPESSANMLRAMLVNQANMPNSVVSTFSDEMQSAYRVQCKRDIERDVAGYGIIDEDVLFRSSENAVVLMAEDKIENNAHHFFELPLPPDYLRSKVATRELRATLAYSPPVRTTRLDYIATRICYRLVKGQSLEEVQRHFNHETQDETDVRNDDATGNREICSSLRDKGTVQSSVWKFKKRNPNEKWFVVVTRQDRDWGVPICMELESYSLVVTVTDRENEDAQLYTQILQRIQQQQRARARV